MRSRTSLFNTGIAKDLLRRFWPLWTGYFALMLFLMPVKSTTTYIARANMRAIYETVSVANIVYPDCTMMVMVSLVVGIVAAMAMFGYLYNTRSCGMVNALPVKRTTMFVTAYLTGLLPLLAADVIAALASMLLLYRAGANDALCVMTQLAVVVMNNISFYGFGVFCAMLTGNLLVLPLVYVVLGLSAWICEGCVRHVLSEFVYGMTVQTHNFDWLSPVVTLTSEIGLGTTDQAGVYYFRGMGWVAAYCAAGIAASVFALLLYRRRNMETATDTVAIPILKPVFKYCMTFGGALVTAYLLYGQIFSGSRGAAAAAWVLLLLLFGAFLGYFVSEMIINKTTDVFRRGWKGFLVSACVLAVLTACFELDAFGYEKRIPVAERVAKAKIYYNCYLEEPENIQAVIDLQGQIIAHKEQNEQAEERSAIHMEYILKSGKVIQREYLVDVGAAAQRDPAADICTMQTIINSPEARQKRTALSIPLNPDTVEYGILEWHTENEKTGYESDSLRLTPEQVTELYEQCILPDIEDGNLGLEWVVWSDEYYDTVTNVWFMVSLRQSGADGTQKTNWDYLDLTVTVNAKRTLAWIGENTDIECLPLRIVSPPTENMTADRPTYAVPA